MKILLIFVALLIVSSTQAQEMIREEDRFAIKPIVKMTLNGKKIWVLLDTGSSINILNLSSQKKYKFKAYRRLKNANSAIGFGSAELKLQRAEDVDLYYKGIKLKGEFLTHDITRIAESFEAEVGLRISAIIGSATMRKYGFTIDMGNNTASINYKKRKKDESCCSEFR